MNKDELCYLDFYGYGFERLSLKVTDPSECCSVEPAVLTLETPVSIKGFGPDPLTVPVACEAKANWTGQYIVTVSCKQYIDTDVITATGSYSLELKDDCEFDEESRLYYATFEVINKKYGEEYGYIVYDDEELKTEIVLPPDQHYKIEVGVEKPESFDYMMLLGTFSSLDGSLPYKGTCNAKVEFADYDGEIIFSSSNESVATVDENGKVTGVGIGSAIITATTEDGTREIHEVVYVKYTLLQWIIRIFLLGFIWY